MAEELNGVEQRETELWQVLDWSLWGNGLGDVLREAIADKALASLSVEERETAERCIKALHERRGPSAAVGEGTELQRQRDLLLWLHAEAVWHLHEDVRVIAEDRDVAAAQLWDRFVYEQDLRRVADLEADRLRREVEFEANGLETGAEYLGFDEPVRVCACSINAEALDLTRWSVPQCAVHPETQVASAVSVFPEETP